MDISARDIAGMVFQRVIREDGGNFSLDSRMLSVLMELDGSRSLGAVAARLGITMGSMREILANLLKLRLIEPVERQVPGVDQDFLDYLMDQLSVAVGPIAAVLIEDEVRNLGFEPNRFPVDRAAELVDRLSRAIRKPEKRSVFQKNMIGKIREKGYYSL